MAVLDGFFRKIPAACALHRSVNSALNGSPSTSFLFEQLMRRRPQPEPAFRVLYRTCYRAFEHSRMSPPGFSAAISAALHGFPPRIMQVAIALSLTYLFPHRARIAEQGRHLLMLTAYEPRGEAHVWFLPLAQAHTRVGMALGMGGGGGGGGGAGRDVSKAGVSRADLQLAETYDAQAAFAVHAELFVSGAGGNGFGVCHWVGQAALFAPVESMDEALMRARELANGGVGMELTEEAAAKSAKEREKRAKKKARQKANNAEAKVQRAEAAATEAEAGMAQAAADRKKGASAGARVPAGRAGQRGPAEVEVRDV
jgi:hypothetical protein